MAITVKGIQYHYQIDFFDQVPTRIKSQVHDLPVLSVPQPTPIDKNIGRDMVILNNDDRFSYSGLRAAPQPFLIGPSVDVYNPEPFVKASAETVVRPELVNNSLAEPPQIQRRIPSEFSVARPATSLAAETVNPSRAEPDEIPVILPEQPPREDATPLEPVKATPRVDYARAMRAYKPDALSYLQPGGYEKTDFSRSDFYNEPEKSQAPVLPTASPVQEVFIPGVTENKAQTVIGQDSDSEIKPEYVGSTSPEEPLPDDFVSKNQLKGENFLARQAFKLYEMIANTGILNTGNQVDLYF